MSISGWANGAALTPVQQLTGTGAATDWWDSVVSPTNTYLACETATPNPINALVGQLGNVVLLGGTLSTGQLDQLYASLQNDIWGVLLF